MKKILMNLKAVFFLVMIVSVNECCAQQNIKNVTLNNIPLKTFEQQLSDFKQYGNNDNEPPMASVWFSSKMIHRLVCLLKKEEADGVRIYFTAQSENGAIKTSIALVSTFNDISTNYKKQSTHRDYFRHDLNDDYFAADPNSITISVSNDNCGGGALLYGPAKLPDLTCPNTNDHYITVSEATDWVQRYRDKKHSINTISEWYDKQLFEKIDTDGNYDGIRIYFCRKKGFLGVLRGRNRLLVATTLNKNGIQRDTFTCQNPFLWKTKKLFETFHAEPPLDNGQLCPYNCN